MTGGVAHVASGGGGVIGAVVVLQPWGAAAGVWVVGGGAVLSLWVVPVRPWWCWWCWCSLRPLVTPGVPGLTRGGGAAGEGRWCHWAAVPLTARPGVLAVMLTVWVRWRQCCGR